MKRKNKRGMLLKKKIKRVFVLACLSFVLGGVFVNSSYVTGYKDMVYASLKDKYGITDSTFSIEEVKDIQESVKVKNYSLTVDTDLRTPSNATSEDINKMLEGTKLYGLGDAFVKAEKAYGVNALYMMGLAALESGYGTSRFAIERNNLYGWNAVDSNPDKAKFFDSKEQATLFVASKLKQNYLTEGGRYFEGYSARAVDVHYCTDKAHADKIINIVNSLVEKLG